VLLVEDGETNRDLISLVLSEAGATVVCAENGQEGVEAANRQPFDLILMDMQMPIMDGYTASRTLHAGGCRLPIIALTAHAMRGDREKCLAAGCTEYLAKPIQVDRLLEAVAAAVGVSGALPPAQSSDIDIATEPSAQITSSLPTEHPRFQAIIERFATTLSDKRTAMQSALDRCDWNQLAELAHWLKGAGGTVGFDCFTEPAQKLERAAKKRNTRVAQELLQQLLALADRIAVPAQSGSTILE
jgi:CheY-like chemotaxis protein